MENVQSRDCESWYAMHCKPFKERLVARRLAEDLELTVYVPEIRTRFRGQIQFKPFFPRYVFVRANLQVASISRINAVAGASRLVTFDDEPQPIPATIIEALRQRLEQFNAQGGLPSHHFHPGDKVWLKAGPLQGLEAVFVGPMKPSERVRILVEFLGQYRQVDVHVNSLDRPSAEPMPGQARRTRGKGRHIHVKG